MLDPAPELPDDTLIGQVRFSTRIRNALNAAGMKTIGEVRETSDDNLLSFQDLGPSSICSLRETLGRPQPTGSDPWTKSPPDLLNFQLTSDRPLVGKIPLARSLGLLNTPPGRSYSDLGPFRAGRDIG